MAFRQPTPIARQLYVPEPRQDDSASTHLADPKDRVEESQGWVIFSPSQAASTTTGTQTNRTPHTAGLSRISDFGSLVTGSGQLVRSNVDDTNTEDGELDSLDEGLHAFREPSVYRSSSNQAHGAVLPTHDGLGTFPASSMPAQEQLWQHEQYHPKRKHEEIHGRRSSVQRRLDTIEELDLQISEDKRMRIEQWRMEQSQALLDEIEKETRRRERHNSITKGSPRCTQHVARSDLLEMTSKQDDTTGPPAQESEEAEPFWRRVARKFIRDVIGIDEPLLSVIVGETLPEDIYTIANLAGDSEETPVPHQLSLAEESWPDRLLRRIARELGLLVHKLSPHPGPFTSASSCVPADYAGIPILNRLPGEPVSSRRPDEESTSRQTPLFSPTIPADSNNPSWGLEDKFPNEPGGATAETDAAQRLRKEREYWERELDIKMVFRFLKGRFSSKPASLRRDPSHQPVAEVEDSTGRADVIRRHHPLVARAHQPSIARLRRNSNRRSLKRSTSSCASESIRSGRRPSLARSGGSSRNYWDIGGSNGSGSLVASGGMMGAWAEG